MRPIDFYELALQMAQTAATEAECRTVINFLLSPSQLMRLALLVAQELLVTLDDYSPGDAPDGCECLTIRQTVPN